MRIKRLHIMITIIVLTAVLGTYLFMRMNQEPRRISPICSLYKRSETLDELESNADVIILGVTDEPFQSRESCVTKYGDGEIQDFYTLTNIRIKKVFKTDSPRIVENCTIQIIEPLAQIDSKTILANADYREIEHNKEYVIFLGQNTFGGYGVINMDLGKFCLDDISDKENKLAKEVHKKYLSGGNESNVIKP